MCGRGVLALTAQRVAALLNALPTSADPPMRSQICPTDPILALRYGEQGRELSWLRWGIGAKKTFNVRSESVAAQTPFREAYRTRRCTVILTGFLEWSGPPKQRKPHQITPADSEVFLLAGIWEQGPEWQSCTILTCDARGPIAELHPRMPVMLSNDAANRWLRGEVSARDAASLPMLGVVIADYVTV